jgi:hypothetical protein
LFKKREIGDYLSMFKNDDSKNLGLSDVDQCIQLYLVQFQAVVKLFGQSQNVGKSLIFGLIWIWRLVQP